MHAFLKASAALALPIRPRSCIRQEREVAEHQPNYRHPMTARPTLRSLIIRHVVSPGFVEAGNKSEDRAIRREQVVRCLFECI